MKIITWNVNSVRARLGCISNVIKGECPDVLLLQEIKCMENSFPFSFFEDMGFVCRVLGQKSYNGVAIVSKVSVEDVAMGLPSFPEDPSARYIEAVVAGKIRIASLYVPNGGLIVNGESYVYKLNFLDKLAEHLLRINGYNEAIIIGGDYNIAPDNRDVYDEKIWHEKVCCTTKERHSLTNLKNIGFADVLENFFDKDEGNRVKKRPFTWWDYKSKSSFAKNTGLRLDLFLANEIATSIIEDVKVEASTRAMEKPSDHAPVIITTKEAS
ncbi:MAG: exodeoxyribonuclease III [Holosporales bacterium]|nr:exodeoxyribonuclease III [Holosporales bacterium]